MHGSEWVGTCHIRLCCNYTMCERKSTLSIATVDARSPIGIIDVTTMTKTHHFWYSHEKILLRVLKRNTTIFTVCNT